MHQDIKPQTAGSGIWSANHGSFIMDNIPICFRRDFNNLANENLLRTKLTYTYDYDTYNFNDEYIIIMLF